MRGRNAAIAVSGLFAAAVLGGLAARSNRPAPIRQPPREQAARQLDLGAATLAGSVLFDSAVEHYRGSFEHRGMYVPLAVASATIAASLSGARQPNRMRTGVHVLAMLTGVAGLGFHIYDISKRPGGWSWQNLFYAAPVGAPGALSLAGLTGLAGQQLRTGQVRPDSQSGRALAALAAIGILGDVAEVWLLHFRGAFHNPAMVLPVTIPPVASLCLAGVAAGAGRPSLRTTRGWLWATAATGLAGVGFHAWGVHRMMGGWRNWSQNLLEGPPLPAPPSYTGLALAGLAATRLMEEAHE
ncbi:hypothetical protein [Paracoccus beibuensis]|uniref:hypothetical protein n=1 Tax=Paracoccus beibuensis TaxID=547602 RepID=UPI00223E9063|nr:hypothetical protein [Paracoccus beibuensis]